MSFYRMFITAVAACGIATSVFAADTSDTQNVTDNNGTQQVADTQSTQGTEQKVDLNKASKKELMAVKGLNAAKARAIISYRKKHGDFKSLDDLKEVKGFNKLNDDQLKSIQDQLTIG
ncbi:MAG: helix-hairpin-helix domain-containing protein [Gammaproteobacteria bacterium]|nr:helix-hairpin-helix domain-containing protein [Gammaproteobacteria bacterium]